MPGRLRWSDSTDAIAALHPPTAINGPRKTRPLTTSKDCRLVNKACQRTWTICCTPDARPAREGQQRGRVDEQIIVVEQPQGAGQSTRHGAPNNRQVPKPPGEHRQGVATRHNSHTLPPVAPGRQRPRQPEGKQHQSIRSGQMTRPGQHAHQHPATQRWALEGAHEGQQRQASEPGVQNEGIGCQEVRQVEAWKRGQHAGQERLLTIAHNVKRDPGCQQRQQGSKHVGWDLSGAERIAEEISCL